MTSPSAITKVTFAEWAAGRQICTSSRPTVPSDQSLGVVAAWALFALFHQSEWRPRWAKSVELTGKGDRQVERFSTGCGIGPPKEVEKLLGNRLLEHLEREGVECIGGIEHLG